MLSGSKKDNLRFRHQFIRSIQQFFDSRYYIEINSPVRIKTPALEDYIDAIPSDNAWLRTSPELHMKQLLAAGFERIYQIGPCFRMHEFGIRHRSEFTMLEYYQLDTDYRELLSITAELLKTVVADCFGSMELSYRKHRINFDDTEIITVDDAFRRYAAIPVAEAIAKSTFEELLCSQVEPQLGLSSPCFLIDYPEEMAALAKLNTNGYAERWELYIGGLELANAYSELCDPLEQRDRFQKTAALRAADGRTVYDIDEQFLTALEQIDNCAGAALGIDRLMMILCDSYDIDDVIAFSENI